MSETPEEAQKRSLKEELKEELEGKTIAYYSGLLAAWTQTRMEKDKALITLSAFAIGLLVTLLTTTVGVRSILELVFFAVAVGSFLITILSILKIYQLNSEYLEEAIRGSSEKDPRLGKYDKLSSRSFITGLISVILIAVVSAIYQFL